MRRKVYCRDCKYNPYYNECHHPKFTKEKKYSDDWHKKGESYIVHGNCSKINRKNDCKLFEQDKHYIFTTFLILVIIFIVYMVYFMMTKPPPEIVGTIVEVKSIGDEGCLVKLDNGMELRVSCSNGDRLDGKEVAKGYIRYYILEKGR